MLSKNLQTGSAHKGVESLPRKIVVITDGDRIATQVVEQVARNVGGRAISLSGGNPTRISAEGLVEAIKEAPYDPVLVMVDDCGAKGTGRGERVLVELARNPEVEILGVLAVASNTAGVRGIKPNVSITRDGKVIDQAVDKDGYTQGKRIKGDTVDILNQLKVPVIVGVGDLGKMENADLVEEGARITTIAVKEILKRSHFRR